MKMRYDIAIRQTQVVFFFVTALTLSSCAKKADAPPEIVPDRSACARCSMLISDGRFAAALKVNDSYLLFDDIGCMLTYANAHGTPASAEMWVRDYSTDKWIGAEQATFVHADGDLTPMGYGYIAVTGSTTKPPIGLKNPVVVGTLAQLRTDYHTRIQ